MLIQLPGGYSVTESPGQIHRYVVHGGSKPYKVTLDPAWNGARCSCPAGIFHRKKGLRCKHEVMVREAVSEELAILFARAAAASPAPARKLRARTVRAARVPAPVVTTSPEAWSIERDVAEMKAELVRLGDEKDLGRKLQGFDALRMRAALFREVLGDAMADVETKLAELAEAMLGTTALGGVA